MPNENEHKKIKQDLVNSCYELNKQNILDKESLSECQKINDNYFKFMKDKEKQIFGENRYQDRINILNNFVEELKKYVEQNKIITDSTTVENLKDLGINIYKLIHILDEKLVNTYYNNEDSNYNALLENYFKMDKNRLNLSNIGQQYGTLERINTIDTNKIAKSNYIYNIIFLIILIIIMVFLIVYITNIN